MTWKERRLITVLSVILAILSAALLIVLGIRYRQSRDAVQDPAAQAAQAAQAAGSAYASLSVYSAAATLSFSIQEDGTWVWDDDTEFPLDDSTIRSIMDLLSDLTPQQVLSDPDSLESYELDAPSASISAVKADQSTVSVTFGKATTDGTSRYATMNGRQPPPSTSSPTRSIKPANPYLRYDDPAGTAGADGILHCQHFHSGPRRGC